MRLNKISLKQAVAMLAATCTLGTCCIAGSVAWAETQGTNTANIETTHAVSLSIHKYQGPASATDQSDGSKKTMVTDKKPVQGVEFTLYKVQKDSKDIDLTKSEGWSEIKKIKDTAKPSDYVKDGTNDTNAQHVFTISEIGKGTTDANGLIKFVKTASSPAVSGEVAVSTLGMSLYVVKETNTTGAKIGGKSVTVTGHVDPFFVTLPLANSNHEWIYNVHVYPKNDTTNEVPTKTASDPNRMDIAEDSTGNTDGTRITWTIAIPLPAPDKDKTYSAIGFSDKLATGLTFDKVQNVRLVKYNYETGKAITGGTDNKKDLTVTTHYTVTPPSTSNQNVLKFELTDTATTGGLAEAYSFYTAAAKATNPKQIAKLEAEVVTKVGKDVTDVKNIANTWAGNVTTGRKDNPCDPATTYQEGDPCYTAPGDTAFYGTLKVIKTDNDNNKPLTGAKFNIYEVTGKKTSGETQTAYTANEIQGLSVADVDNDTKTYTLKTSNDNGTKVDSKLVGTTLTTKANTAKTEASDSVKLFVRKKSETGVTNKVYCAVETKAPAGYDLLDKPVCYSLVEDSATNKTGNTQTVKDVKSTPMSKIVGALPMTGARGLVILTLCGIVGIASTFFYIVMKRRKEQEQE